MTIDFLKMERQSPYFVAPGASSQGPFVRIAPFWAHLCHQPFSAEVGVGQRQCSEGPRGILFQPAVAHHAKSSQEGVPNFV
jgi:hypothetical protein